MQPVSPRSLSSLASETDRVLPLWSHPCPSNPRGLSRMRREGETPRHTGLTKLKGSGYRGGQSRPPTVLQAPL